MDICVSLCSIEDEIKTCRRCSLCEERVNAVPGQGNSQARLMFIGEAPGKNEDEKGIPFCGASGKLLDEMLTSINLSRKSIYITNIVKCRPPKNRDPKPEEKEICTRTYLNRQIEAINPDLIVTLGRHSLNYFFPDAKIADVHGTKIEKNGRFFLPLYHPAFAIYNRKNREILFNDFKNINNN